MTDSLLARAAQSWSFQRRRAGLRDACAYALSLLAVIAVDGVVALAIGYALWAVLRART